MDYLQDQYVIDQAKRTDIKSEKECISGSASLYSAITPNVQAGAEAVIDAQIYNQGIVRVCATSNPGDVERWINVGTCGGGINCYLDKDSVKGAVNLPNSTQGLEKATKDSLEKLRREGNYLDETEFGDLLEKIDKAKNEEKIKLIDGALDEKSKKKVFFDREKVQLMWLKARAYFDLVVEKITKKGETPVATTEIAVTPASSEADSSAVESGEAETATANPVEEKTCEDCGAGLINILCDEEECLGLGNCEYSFWSTKRCVDKEEEEKVSCEKIGEDYIVDISLKIFNSVICKNGEEKGEDTGYYLVDNGDKTYQIKNKEGEKVGSVLESGYVRDDSKGRDNLMTELIKYTFKDNKFELKPQKGVVLDPNQNGI